MVNAFKKGFKQRLVSILITSFLIISFLYNIQLMKSVNAQQTVLKVDPSSVTVGSEGTPITEQNITITIKVDNVQNLFGWQIVLYYNSSVLRTKASYVVLPPDHVFSGRQIAVNTDPILGTDQNGAYIMKNVIIAGGEPTFYGSGKLLQITFTTVGNLGISPLLFSKGDNVNGSVNGYYSTYLQDYPDLNEIPAYAVEGSVEVKGIPPGAKEPSVITINSDTYLVYVGHNVIISGNVTKQDGTPKSSVSVDIYRRLSIESPENYHLFATASTNETGIYTYTWTPTEMDLGENEMETSYVFKAAWDGDVDSYGDESDEITITVAKPWIALVFVGERVFGVEKKPETLPKTFTINLTANFNEIETQIHSWQVKLLYDADYLEFINASMPHEHIFQNSSFTWSYTNNTSERYILINAALNDPNEDVTVTGNVTLCALTFNATRTTLGTTAKIKFDTMQTLLINSIGFKWAYLTVDYEASIYGKEIIVKVGSIITIEVVPTVIYIKQSAIIRGNLTFVNGTGISDAVVTVTYESDDKVIKGTLTNKTDSNGSYTITFMGSNEPYEFTFKASWAGTSYVSGNLSQTVKLTVTERGAFTSDVWFYPTVAAIFVIVAIDIVVTLRYVRKPKEEMPTAKPLS
ncbi:MAG: hypothetical protein ACPLW8_03865 [Candidatus Bathyarchaeales archaeon]